MIMFPYDDKPQANTMHVERIILCMRPVISSPQRCYVLVLAVTFLLKVITSFIRVDIDGCAMLLYSG